MKFRQQLWLASIIAALLLCFFITVTGIIVYNKNIRTDLKYTEIILEKFAKQANIFSSNVLTDYTEKYLQSQTLNKAFKAMDISDFSKSSFKQIKNSEKLNKLFQKTLKVNNKSIGYFALLEGMNKVIFAPEEIKHLSKCLLKIDKFPETKKLRSEVLKNDYTAGYLHYYDISGKNIVKKYAVFKRLENSKYFVAGLINIDCYHKATGDSFKILMNKYLKIQKTQLNDFYGNSVINKILFFLSITIILMIIYLLAINFLVKSITKPLNLLINKVKIFNPQNPDFSVNLPKNTSQEIIDLTEAFSAQEHELITYMNNFKTELENRHIIEHDLKVARKIQRSVIPKNKADFCPEEFSLSAKLISAESVAGDFYDYFFVDDNTLVILIADVPGKGIPAAFYMQRSTTLLHSYSFTERKSGPGKVLEKTNNELAANNDVCMFVTAFIGFYDIKTGMLTYANAGHVTPFKILNQNVSRLESESDLALGVIKNYNYKTKTVQIEKNEILILLTNGVLNIISGKNDKLIQQQFSEILLKYEHLSVHDLSDQIIKIINETKNLHNNQLQDDVTLITFKRNK